MADDEKTTEETEETTQNAAEETTEATETTEDLDHKKALMEGQDEAEIQEETPTTDDQSASQAPDGETEETDSTEAEVKEPSFLDSVKEMGWDGDNEQEAQQALLRSFSQQTEDYRRLEERLAEQEELARYGTQFLREQRERQEAEAQSQKPEDGKDEKWWSPPTFDPAMLDQYRDVAVGEDGEPKIGWKANTPKEIIQQAEDYQQYLEKWASDLVQRPQEVLPRVIEQEFNRLFEERISEREEAERMSSFANEVKEANKDWMYTVDLRGQETLTPEGQRMTGILSEISDAGVTDPQVQWELAVARYDYLNNQRTAATETASEDARETASKKRKAHQKKGARRGVQQNRSGTVPRPEDESGEPQNANLTPGQQLVERMRLDGAEF